MAPAFLMRRGHAKAALAPAEEKRDTRAPRARA
jgi:hypothetical protein